MIDQPLLIHEYLFQEKDINAKRKEIENLFRVPDTETSCEVLAWLDQWDLDPLEPRYEGQNFILSIFELNGISWETKSQILQYIVANDEKYNREIQRVLNYRLVQAVKTGIVELFEILFNEGEDLHLVDKQYSLIKCLIDWMEFYEDDVSLKILKILKDKGAKIKEKHLFHSLAAAPSDFIIELFKDQEIAWNSESALKCLSKVKYRNEIAIWELLKRAKWPFQTLVNEENKGILCIAIEERNLEFVRWLLKQGIAIQEKEIRAAHNCGDLEILECLISREKIIEHLLDPTLSLQEAFPRYFLFSKLEKINEYLLSLKKGTHSHLQRKLDSLYHQTFYQTSMIARYAHTRDLTNICVNYAVDLDNYLQNQLAFGATCHEAVLKMLTAMKQGETDLLSLLFEYAQVRNQIAEKRNENEAENYIQFRTLIPEAPVFTPFGSLIGKHFRYSYIIPWMKETINSPNSQEFEKEEGGYKLYYCDPETKNRYPLTFVDLSNHHWLHTITNVFLELWPKLQKMHEELLSTKISPSAPSFQIKEFQDKVATAYWLGCNLMLTTRGNAQYFLMWLSTLLQYHGFDPLLIKREIHQADPLAITLPLSHFVAAFPTFFENPLFKEDHIQVPFDRPIPQTNKKQLLEKILDKEAKQHRDFLEKYNASLASAIRSGNLSDLESLFKEKEMVDFSPLLDHLIESMEFHPENLSLNILKWLKKKGAKVQDRHLFQALRFAPISFIDELLKDITIVWNQESASLCLYNTLFREEKELWERLKRAGWPFEAMLNEENHDILRTAIEERNLNLIEWLLKQKKILVESSHKEAAWQCQDLEIAECFFSTEEILERLLSQHRIFSQLLPSYFLFSNLEKIQEYMRKLVQEVKKRPALNGFNLEKTLETIYNDTQRQIALVARYARKRDLSNISINYEIDLQNYTENQIQFGKICNQAVTEILSGIKERKINLVEMISQFAEKRHWIPLTKKDKDAEKFRQLRTFSPEGDYYTLFGSLSGHRTRYSHVIPWMREVSQREDSEEWERKDRGYQLFYTHPETRKRYPLTTVDLEEHLWAHTKVAVAEELLPYLQQMHEELLKMAVDKRNFNDVKQFQDQVAKAYWLGCHLMLSKRGNAQYFLMWLSTLLQNHGFDPLIIKREIHQADTLAISLPLSDFIAAFPSLFENPLFHCGKSQDNLLFDSLLRFN